MNDKNILREVKKWQELLGLQDWNFIVDPVKNSIISDHGELAKVYISEESMSAGIVIAIDLPDEEIKRSIQHELLHVVLHDLGSTFNDTVDLLGVESRTALSSRYNKCEEKLVIKLERLIDKLIPKEERIEEKSE